MRGTRSHIMDGLRISRRAAPLKDKGRDWQMIFLFISCRVPHLFCKDLRIYPWQRKSLVVKSRYSSLLLLLLLPQYELLQRRASSVWELNCRSESLYDISFSAS